MLNDIHKHLTAVTKASKNALRKSHKWPDLTDPAVSKSKDLETEQNRRGQTFEQNWWIPSGPDG
jgi:hypothetical protein